MTTRHPAAFHRRLRLAVVIAGASLALGACNQTGRSDITGTLPPTDYRLRHPIVVQESIRNSEIFVGSARGGLTAAQRTDVAALGEAWLAEGTGAIIAEVPVGTPNARAAQESLREVQTLLGNVGVPPRGITVRQYHPEDQRLFATIRLKYPRIVADAGPCGTWPEDLGPSINNKSYLNNKPYFNLGCANQHNLAVMTANPTDLVQPRAEGQVYAARRSFMIDKYRQGQATTTTYTDADKNKISSVGQ
ncbi:CpaD family pilus assembly protein [Tardiphaga sp.]|uniref:CpaD family pilus assembly protein n=1 Tax=Tardiphaga sp. TaxID=1926292 RepID=UPI002610D930|nr:CpaD family pilus assembly protein [Tardiphaga sp.]MDB5618659.1 pilus assembly protein CpaD [Tardiphaga sp.]